MPHIELTAIERKIQDTEKELQNLVAFSDDTMRTIMTSELDYRLSELKKQILNRIETRLVRSRVGKWNFEP